MGYVISIKKLLRDLVALWYSSLVFTKKGHFKWIEATQNDFQHMKNVITSNLVLSLPTLFYS
jgi:hypothetical protein